MTAYNPAGGKTYTLAASISSTATSITLSSFALPVSGTLITMAVLNTDIAYGTIGPKTSSAEFISFTGITQNANGTATLTGVTRGLDKVSPFTTNATYKLPHSGQTLFILSDAPQVFNEYAAKRSDNTFTGTNLFSGVAPQTNVDPVAGNDLARLSYIQALVLGTLTTINVIVPGTAGETLANGNLIYLKTADNRWWKCDADDPATVNNVLLGIAQGAGTAGNAIASGVLLQGDDDAQSGLTGGTIMYASNTAGGISATPGTNEVTVGIAKSATELYFVPRFNQQLTENQQDALDGAESPTASNVFITQSRFQKNSEKYAADAGGTDAYAITLSPALTAYTTGMLVSFKANTVNTGAATLNINSLGAITIVKGVNTTLSDGDILAGQLCTVIYDGTNFVLQNPVATNSAVSSIPKVHISTAFETAARFTVAVTGSGAGSFGTSGRSINTGGGVAGSADTLFNLVLAPYLGSPTFTANVNYTDPGGGANFTSFVGIGALTVATAGITFTGRHIGFKTVGLNLIATQADGTTETASGTLTTITSGDNIDLAFKINGTSSVDYYWRKAGGTWSAATNLTANMPSGTTTTLQIATSSNSSANGLTLTSSGMAYER